MLRVARLLPLFLLFLFQPGSVGAQQVDRPPGLSLGDAVVTGFSGTVAPDPTKPRPANRTAVDLTFINPDGPSARIIGLGRPGFVWDATWRDLYRQAHRPGGEPPASARAST